MSQITVSKSEAKMKKMFVGLVIVLWVAASFLPILSAAEENLDYTYGVVVSISQKSIQISEYDLEKGGKVNIDYKIDPAVELMNISSLQEISAGDNVAIEYSTNGEEKIAKSIEADKKFPGNR